MAQLPSYTNNIDLQPGGNVGGDAMNSDARRVGPLIREGGLMEAAGLNALGQSVNEVLKQREANAGFQEILSGMTQHAANQMQNQQLWNQTVSQTNPADMGTAAQAFIQNVLVPQGQKFIEGFQTEKGRQWAQEAVTNEQVELFKQAHKDAASAAGDAAQVAATQTLNTLSAAALQDPSSFNRVLHTWQTGVEALANNPMLTPEQASKIRNELGQHGASVLAFAAGRGAVESNPALGTKLVDSGAFGQYLTVEQRDHLMSTANATAKMNAADARQARMEQRQQASDDVNKQFASLIQSTINPNGGPPQIPSDFNQRLAAIGNLPGMAEHPGLLETGMNYRARILAEQAAAAKSVTDPDTYKDFDNRLFSQDNPVTEQQVIKARADGLLSQPDYEFLKGAVNAGVNNPQMVQDRDTFKGFLAVESPNKVGSDFLDKPKDYYLWSKDKEQDFWRGRAAGIPARDLVDPTNKNFLGLPSKAEAAGYAARAAAEATPQNAQQASLSRAVDIATQVTTLARKGTPQETNSYLKTLGIDIDVTKSGWCAALVNYALGHAGLPTTGSNLASSFKNYGFAVSPDDVKNGDVFYVPAEGYTGHVGIATGQKRQGPDGQLQIQVVSSHLQGEEGNNGGVEWRNAGNMLLRRSKPPVADIANGGPGIVSRFFRYTFGTDKSQTSPDAGDSGEQ